MPKALANRLLHFNISTSFNNWKKWALHSDIHPLVLGFLSSRPDLLNTFDSSNESLAFSTPRSWEMVSNILNNVSDDIEEVYSLIAGLVGGGIAFELRTYATVYQQLPKIEDIFAGKAVSVPRKISEIFALSAMMVRRVKERKEDYVGIANSIKFVSRFPADFGILVLEEYLSIDESYRRKLLMLPEFSRWLNANAGILNGQVHGLFK